MELEIIYPQKEKLYHHLNRQFRKKKIIVPTNGPGTTGHLYPKVNLDPHSISSRKLTPNRPQI